MTLRRGQQLGQPVGIHPHVGVEQGYPRSAGFSRSPVAAAAVAKVGARIHRAHPREAIANQLQSAVVLAVHHQDELHLLKRDILLRD